MEIMMKKMKLSMIQKYYRTTIDDPENLDLDMSKYNLIEYTSHHSETTGSLYFYSKDEAELF